MNNQKNIIVIGGGAAGMIAAIAAAKEGCAVSLYEKNEKPVSYTHLDVYKRQV